MLITTRKLACLSVRLAACPFNDLSLSVQHYYVYIAMQWADEDTPTCICIPERRCRGGKRRVNALDRFFDALNEMDSERQSNRLVGRHMATFKVK